jgi:hypothetical protein
VNVSRERALTSRTRTVSRFRLHLVVYTERVVVYAERGMDPDIADMTHTIRKLAEKRERERERERTRLHLGVYPERGMDLDITHIIHKLTEILRERERERERGPADFSTPPHACAPTRAAPCAA